MTSSNDEKKITVRDRKHHGKPHWGPSILRNGSNAPSLGSIMMSNPSHLLNSLSNYHTQPSVQPPSNNNYIVSPSGSSGGSTVGQASIMTPEIPTSNGKLSDAEMKNKLQPYEGLGTPTKAEIGENEPSTAQRYRMVAAVVIRGRKPKAVFQKCFVPPDMIRRMVFKVYHGKPLHGQTGRPRLPDEASAVLDKKRASETGNEVEEEEEEHKSKRHKSNRSTSSPCGNLHLLISASDRLKPKKTNKKAL